jgi:hypothetical protein
MKFSHGTQFLQLSDSRGASRGFDGCDASPVETASLSSVALESLCLSDLRVCVQL